MIELRLVSSLAWLLGGIPDPLGLYPWSDCIRMVDEKGRGWLWPLVPEETATEGDS